ncbi:MAG: homoserine dehydrogenase [Ruminococcaceae bacterium]|nr:homoserine dehydrogenase [Oscillospiraceae bacterium]
MISIALLGFGCVGSGTAEVLTENKKIIEARLGCEYQIKYILDLREFPESPFGNLIVHDFNTILNDDEVTVVAEMMGGSHPAYDFTKACLEAGKSVITSNKEVVAKFGVELCAIAAKSGARYMFEASVGGGIPLIRPMTVDLASNKIKKINGILNGTTNYIITSMRDCGVSFEDALKEAQKLGYAEANPAADIEGIDAARKAVILGAVSTGKLISPEVIHREGVTKITLSDVALARKLGYEIKLIGYVEDVDGKLMCFVSPMAVPTSNPLARVDGVFNGVLINANMVGEVMFYGPGAGKLPTASAVVADIVDVIAKRNVEPSSLDWVAAKDNDIADFAEFSCRRMVVTKDASDGCVESDGLYAYISDVMTEKEADAMKNANASVVAIYRML